MSSYPKWLYHSTKAPALVADEAAHKALGTEWAETPAAFKAEAKTLGSLLEEPKKEAETTAELAEELGAKAGLKTSKKVK